MRTHLAAQAAEERLEQRGDLLDSGSRDYARGCGS
jgi:hypothetical protein